MKIFLLILFVVVFVASCDKSKEVTKEPFIRSTICMGTSLEIKVLDFDEDSATVITNLAIEEAERINQKFSTYIDDNYMAWLNSVNDTLIQVDDETYFLLERCDKIHNETLGGFDPAVGNLIDLLGFEKGSPHLPSQHQIDSVLKEVGWKHIELLGSNSIKKKSHIKLNFGGIAKGYAVDRLFHILDSLGMDNFLINFGGEVKAKGDNWTIGIQHPRIQKELLGVLKLDQTGSATSGDYERYFKKDNKRYNHIINPVSGYPADECMSVTIIGSDMTDADGYATGIFVLGAKKGLEIIESIPEIEGMVIDSAGTTFMSTGFDKYFRSN
ncbi:MAG: FAD:protein FMN transferase [Desulfobulbaceae bacterium]|nr:FAD:protein FMN transferase [Candidatus Kapabacteria bacterium]MBS3999800.1 FAD:protein FMN transferase [Desulfobulbaceae bacterium]